MSRATSGSALRTRSTDTEKIGSAGHTLCLTHLTPLRVRHAPRVPDSPLPSWEELQRTLYETNAYCAALYLGRSSAASLSDALPELLAQKGLDGISYLADIAASACVEQPGDEVFILIPRGDKVLSLYNYVLETQSNYDAYPGALLYSSAERCAVAVRCNESDVRPNVLAVFSGLDGEQSFSPRITLENETLLSAPGVYTLTPAL